LKLLEKQDLGLQNKEKLKLGFGLQFQSTLLFRTNYKLI